MDEKFEHLTDAQIEQYGNRISDSGPDENQELETHLAACAGCRIRVLSSQRTRLAGLADPDLTTAPDVKTVPQPDCPAEDDLRHLAAGLCPPDQASKLTQHAAQCDHCGPILRTYTEDFSDESSAEDQAILGHLQSASPAWQSDVARTMHAAAAVPAPVAPQPVVPESVAPNPVIAETRVAPPPSAVRFRFPWFKWVLVPTAVAACAVVAFFVWYQQRDTPEKVEKLLAQAYTEQRTMEMRFPGAAWSPMHVTRGPDQLGTRQPASLLSAAALTQTLLRKNPNSSKWLQAQGHVELLDWRLSEALSHFETALQLQSDSADLDIDIAITYYDMAQTTDRGMNCARAIEYFSKALEKRPNDLIALYNRAISHECVQAYQSSLEDWNHYLELDPNSRWAKEGMERRDRIRDLLRSHHDSNLRSTPGDMLPRDSLDPQGQTRTGFASEQPEDFSEILGSFQAASATRVDNTSLGRIASLLADKHHDLWLSDALDELNSSRRQKAFTELTRAVIENAHGKPDDALKYAATAQRLSPPGSAIYQRAAYEQVYALRRQAKACVNQARSVAQASARHAYGWLKVQSQLELTSCLLLDGQLDAAQVQARRAVSLASEGNNASLHIRCLAFEAAINRRKGELKESWAASMMGLNEFWSTSSNPIRAYGLYADLSFLAEDLTLHHLARSFATEAVAMVKQTDNRSAEAMARTRLANLILEDGGLSEAESEYQLANRLFASLSNDSTTETYRIDSQLGLARIEMEKGNFLGSEQQLSRAQDALGKIHSLVVLNRFYFILGQLQYQQGRLTEAEKSLASAILAAERELSSLNHRWDRELWNRHNRPVYALLVQLELDRGDQNRAFALWLWYQSAAERNVIESRSALKTYAANNIDLDELQHLFRIQLPEFKTARNGYDTAFFYAVLPKQVAIWVSQNGAIRFSTPKAGIDKLQRLSAQLVEECSTPASSVTLIRAHARELYSLLIGASHEQLTSSKLLIVPDDFLFSVPFNVLIGPDGRYLGTKVPIVIVLHGGSRDTHLQPSIRTANTVVASSATTPDIRVALAGVNEEAAVVQSKLKNAIVVSGESASAERMEELLTRATLFHFAGHSLASQGELNLVLPGRVNEPYTLFPISRLAPAQMRKCHLVVLSACSTLGLDHGIHRNSYTGVGLFLRAGAQFVVASRWNIDSVRTIEYMSRFYSSLHTNADVAVAMRNAQTYTDSVSDHPYYWAPFGVFGAYERLL